MSDEQQTNEQPTLPRVPLNAETLEAAIKASNAVDTATVVAEERKPTTLDPYILFTQVDQMRKEGVDEDTIREAFNQFMSERSDTSRKAVPKMKRSSQGLPPIPSQEEINKLYTEKALGKEILNQDMVMILEELENSRIRRSQEPTVPVLTLKQRLARRVMVFMLGVTIWVFKKLGVQ